MLHIAQDDLFGAEPTVIEENPAPVPDTKVRWLNLSRAGFGAATLTPEAQKDRALKLLGVPREPGQSHLAAWRDEMARRSGADEVTFRRWLDYEVNIHGNKSLALFIWALA